MSATEYRIEFQIQRRQSGDDDFTEIGFGSSGGDISLEGALYAVESIVGCGHWETEPGQPDADEVMAELSEARAAR